MGVDGEKFYEASDTIEQTRDESRQWRRQNLLWGGAKMEIMSWGTHDGLQGRVQQLLDDNIVLW